MAYPAATQPLTTSVPKDPALAMIPRALSSTRRLMVTSLNIFTCTCHDICALVPWRNRDSNWWAQLLLFPRWASGKLDVNGSGYEQ